MRKPITLAGVSVSVLALASAAIAAQTQTLELKVTPAKAGTAKKARGVSVDFTAATSDDTGAKPSPATRAIIRFNKGFKFNGKAFPTCDKADLAANQPEKCEPAKVGGGAAESDARPIIPTPVKSTVTAYNGKPKSGKDTLLLYIKSSVGQPVTLEGVIRNDPQGPYGPALDVTVPPLKVLGVSVVLTKVQVTTLNLTGTKKSRGKRVKVPYVEAPTFCKRSWRFAGEFTYESGLTNKPTGSVVCSK